MDDRQSSPAWWRRFSSLDLGRIAALAYALIGLASLLPQLFIDPRSASVRPLGIIGFVGLGTVVVLTFVRRRLLVAEPLLSPVLIVLAGIGFADPYSTLGLAQRVVPPQSLYGSHISAAIRTVLICIALPVVVLLSPTAASRHAWNSPTILGAIPSILVLAVLVRVLMASVVRQTLAAERVRLLIATGTRLLSVTDVEEVRAVTGTTANALALTAPGSVAVLLRLGEEAVVMGVAGADAPAMGTRLPVAPFDRLADGGIHAIQIAALVPYVGRLWWRSATLDLADERWLVIVGAPRPVPDDVMDAFALLASQRTEGEDKSRAHAELAYRAGHDSITGLLNRAEFLARLEQVMDSGRPREIAVIVIDLDDFKTINDTYGHQAGDRVLRVVADRMREVLATAAPATANAARLGGDEFAVLIAADSRDQTASLAATIHERIQEPITVDGATMPVWTSLGLVYRSANLAATELLDNADLAMYRAKEGGKRRMAEYSPDDRAVSTDRERSRLYPPESRPRD